jgi:hypothetical protein
MPRNIRVSGTGDRLRFNMKPAATACRTPSTPVSDKAIRTGNELLRERSEHGKAVFCESARIDSNIKGDWFAKRNIKGYSRQWMNEVVQLPRTSGNLLGVVCRPVSETLAILYGQPARAVGGFNATVRSLMSTDQLGHGKRTTPSSTSRPVSK